MLHNEYMEMYGNSKIIYIFYRNRYLWMISISEFILSGIILCMCIGWVHIENDPCTLYQFAQIGTIAEDNGIMPHSHDNTILGNTIKHCHSFRKCLIVSLTPFKKCLIVSLTPFRKCLIVSLTPFRKCLIVSLTQSQLPEPNLTKINKTSNRWVSARKM